MLAKFEKLTLDDAVHISVHKYQNLRNLSHWHIEHELVFCDYGIAKISVGSEQYTLEKGHCLFVASGMIHNINTITESVVSVIKIEQELIDDTFGGLVPVCPLIETDLPLDDVFNRLHSEIIGNKRFGSVVCDCTILETLSLLFRNCPMTERSMASTGEKYKALLSLIDQRFADITFDDAAEFMCYSKPYFSRYFSIMTGMTFSSYLNIIRVSEAVVMLKEGRLTVSEIAHASGFGTIRHFNRVFKELTGYSPCKLPNDFVFIRYRRHDNTDGFDPTLSAPAIL